MMMKHLISLNTASHIVCLYFVTINHVSGVLTVGLCMLVYSANPILCTASTILVVPKVGFGPPWRASVTVGGPNGCLQKVD